jgi:hypothetical protein
MTTREEILKALDGEEEYQLDRWTDHQAVKGRSPHDRTLDEWILYISRYAQQAIEQTVTGDEEAALHTVRKVASLAFNCMYQYGAPQREGHER